jgi:hypothetical protein
MRGSLLCRAGFRTALHAPVKEVRSAPMPSSQLAFFLIWLAAALAAGVAIYVIWQWFYARSQSNRDGA